MLIVLLVFPLPWATCCFGGLGVGGGLIALGRGLWCGIVCVSPYKIGFKIKKC